MKKNNAFDFLRLFAALTVVVGHATSHFNIPFLWHGKNDTLWFYDGVAMFFVLSGMMVYKSCFNAFQQGHPIKYYFLNRYLRVAPAIYVYLILTVLSLFIIGIINSKDLNFSFFAWIVSTIILFPVYHPDFLKDFGVGVMNGSLWTIPVEFSFYILLPIFVLFQRKWNFKVMSSVMLILSTFSLILFNMWSHQFSHNTPIWLKLFGVTLFPYLIFFTVGIILGRVWFSIPQSKLVAFVSLFLYILIRHEIIVDKESVYLYFELLWVLPFGYFVIWFGYNAPSIFYKLTNAIGDISYGVYIWHMVVINYFIYFNLNNKINGNILVIIVLISTCIISLMSWWFVEKQALKLKPYNTKMNSKKIISKSIQNKQPNKIS